MKPARFALVPPRPAPASTAPKERGVVWYAEDIQEQYGRDRGGRWRKSRKWILKKFCPGGRHKDGKHVWWWSAEALAFMEGQRERMSA